LLYKRYVDDTIVFYRGNTRQLEIMNKYLNQISPNLQFTLEAEKDNKINFLDLTLTKDGKNIKFSVYRKPTATDHTIHKTSYHPNAHKMAAYNSMVHRLLSIPMDPQDYETEVNIIKYIAVANGYESKMIDEIICRKKNKNKNKPSNSNQNQPQFVSVEYGQSLHNTLNKELNKQNVKLSCRTTNNLSKHLNTSHKKINNDSGIYRLNCSNCPKFYIGQTGRSFKKRFSEHLPKKSLKIQRSKFAEHLINCNHSVNSMEENLKILHKCKKSHFMNTMEELHIYSAFKTQQNNVLNEKLKYSCNVLFNSIEEIQRKSRHKIREVQGQQVGIR
jgi:hypothetical protein